MRESREMHEYAMCARVPDSPVLAAVGRKWCHWLCLFVCLGVFFPFFCCLSLWILVPAMVFFSHSSPVRALFLQPFSRLSIRAKSLLEIRFLRSLTLCHASSIPLSPFAVASLCVRVCYSHEQHLCQRLCNLHHQDYRPRAACVGLDHLPLQ